MEYILIEKISFSEKNKTDLEIQIGSIMLIKVS